MHTRQDSKEALYMGLGTPAWQIRQNDTKEGALYIFSEHFSTADFKLALCLLVKLSWEMLGTK